MKLQNNAFLYAPPPLSLSHSTDSSSQPKANILSPPAKLQPNTTLSTTPKTSTMALTRGSTGNSKPRILQPISTSPATTRKPRAKKSTTTKANTGKKRTGTGVVGSKVTKKPAATHKRKTSVKDKVAGAVEKMEEKVEGKPGKTAAGTVS